MGVDFIVGGPLSAPHRCWLGPLTIFFFSCKWTYSCMVKTNAQLTVDAKFYINSLACQIGVRLKHLLFSMIGTSNSTRSLIKLIHHRALPSQLEFSHILSMSFSTRKVQNSLELALINHCNPQ